MDAVIERAGPQPATSDGSLDAQTFEDLLLQVRRFVEQRLRPLEDQVGDSDEMPESIVQEMRDLGLFGLSIPAEFGGLGLTMLQEVRVAIELGRVSPAFRAIVGTNVGIGSQGIVMFGTDEQREGLLPRIASGEIVTSFALTESDAGSDSAAVRTRAERRGSDYVLNGTKRFITNADRAGLFTVIARTDPDRPGAGGVSAFLVPRDTPGLSVGKAERKMGQQGVHIHDVILEDAIVPESARLGREGEGFKVAMRVLDRGRLHIGAICVGVAERLIDDCLRYASERQQFRQPIGAFQLIQAMIADCHTEATAARAMVLQAAEARDRGEDVVLAAAACKYFASETVGRVADRAVQIFGGAGYVAGYGIERLYRDVRVFRIYEGTSQIQQLVIARELQKRLAG